MCTSTLSGRQYFQEVLACRKPRGVHVKRILWYRHNWASWYSYSSSGVGGGLVSGLRNGEERKAGLTTVLFNFR
jgi:hypothetical protein